MSEILNFYQQQALTAISPIAWLAALQEKALQDFNEYGFPTRHNEEWKYTQVDAFLQQQFFNSVTKQQESIPAMAIQSYSEGIIIYNGHVLASEQFIQKLPKGVLVGSITDILQTHPQLVQPYLGQLLEHKHGFHALNTALLNSGMVIYLPARSIVDEPIVLRHWRDKAQQAVHSRYLIIAEANSQATIIDDFYGADECCYLTNVVTEVSLAAGAKINHYKIQRESKNAFHVGHIIVRQAANSEFHSHSLSLGGKIVRSDLTINLQEEQASCLMNGLYLPGDNQHIDHHTTVNHLVPHCQSVQNYKGILKGRSRAVFNGKVIVAKNAQRTQAEQQNKNLLLSAQAEIDTKPQLEIFADDVVCSHGATVGQLDEDAIFYLATRGISRPQAVAYLIQAFTANNLCLVSNHRIREWITTLLNKPLGD